jgi:hypothetical protein
MNIPRFSAEASLGRSGKSFVQVIGRTAPADVVIPQGCNIAEGAACFFYPIAWCAWGSLRDSSTFCDCVDRLSGGRCLECTNCAGSGRGLDPRGVGSGQSQLTQDPMPAFVAAPTAGGRESDLSSLKHQLNRIEACACGTKMILNLPLPIALPSEVFSPNVPIPRGPIPPGPPIG